MSIGAKTKYDLTHLLDEIEREEDQLRNVRLNARHKPIPFRQYVLAFAIVLATLIAMVLP